MCGLELAIISLWMIEQTSVPVAQLANIASFLMIIDILINTHNSYTWIIRTIALGLVSLFSRFTFQLSHLLVFYYLQRLVVLQSLREI